MIKYIIILMNMLALFIMRVFYSPDVMVTTSIPTDIKLGDQITVSVIINKGSIAGVGHLKHELPGGFKNATMVDAKGAEFKYLAEDNVVKFTWVSLPAEQQFTVSYKFTVDSTMALGNYTIASKFSYVLDNKKQTYESLSPNLTVGRDLPAIASTPVTPQPDTTKVAPIVIAKKDSTIPTTTVASITTSRNIIGTPEAGSEFTVEINIKKEGTKGFALIQETLPIGLTAMPLKNQGGTFSFADGVMKIIWDNLPADENINVSYRVSVAETATGSKTISGSYSYIENDDPKKIDIAENIISIKEKTPALATVTTPDNTTTKPDTTKVDNTKIETASVAPVITTAPAPENTIAYKVQICALSKTDRSTFYFQSKFSIAGKVNMEFHEGWRKYIVGKYNQYKDARDYRETVRSKGIENPFVTAYNNGKRITVQEALMVSSQQWIR